MPQRDQSKVRGNRNRSGLSLRRAKREMYLPGHILVICDFELISKQTDTNITISVIAAKDKIELRQSLP